MNIMLKKSLQALTAAVLLSSAGSVYAVNCWKGVCFVEKGDTLAKIARANDTSWRHLMKVNRLKNPNKLLVGQRIRLSN